MQKPKAQSSVEYLTITAFMLVIIVVIFALSFITTDQTIKTRQTSESLEGLVQTADLVYAMGKGNVLFAEVIWPNEVSSISVWYICKTNVELAGCTGTGVPETSCGTNPDCIKYSAIKLSSSVLGSDLIYPSKGKLSIKDPGTSCTASDGFLAKGVKYEVKVTGTDTGIQLERYCLGGGPAGGCTDGEARNCPLQLGVCIGVQETCAGEAWPGCNAATYGALYETAEENCTDLSDNDCDGKTDCVDATDCGSDPACSGATATLVAYYKAEGNAADSSGTGNNGAWFGTPAYQSGVSGQAFDFPGNSGTGVAVVDSSSLDLTTGITLAAWVNRRNYSGHYKVVIKPYDMFNTEPWELYSLDFKGSSPGYPCFLISTGVSGGQTGACGNSSTLVPLNEWHHIAGTYNGSIAKVYHDGQPVASEPASITIGTNNEAFYINGVQGQAFHINGLTDEVKVYNGALTDAEICVVCNEFKPVGATCNCDTGEPSATPIGYWKFNGNCNDESGKGNNCTFVGGAYSDGSSLVLDGLDDYANCGNDASLNLTSSLTISAWVKPTSYGSSNYPRIVDKGCHADACLPNPNGGYTFSLASSWGGEPNTLTYVVYNGWVQNGGSNIITLNQWQQVAIVYDDSNGKLRHYVNGVRTKETDYKDSCGATYCGAPLPSDVYPLVIGIRDYDKGRPFIGQMDEVKIYNAPKTDAEICSICKEAIPAGATCNC